MLPELSIPAAGQKDRRLWGREWVGAGRNQGSQIPGNEDGVDLANMADGEATPQQSQQSSEEPVGMRAVLIGATGAIGECLLGELLCSKVCLMGSITPPSSVCILISLWLYKGSLTRFTNAKNRGSRITDVKISFPESRK